MQCSARPLSIIASCQQDLQLIKSVLTSIDISVKKVNDIIKKLDPNKAHVHDKISIRMLKLCRYLIKKPVATIFKNCLNERMFPNEWKKTKYSTN